MQSNSMSNLTMSNEAAIEASKAQVAATSASVASNSAPLPAPKPSLADLETTPSSPYARVQPGSFEVGRHYYPRVLNAELHPLLRFFLNLDNRRISKRYAHLRPGVDAEQLEAILNRPMSHFRWSGCDLLHVATGGGKRQMVVVETNSCPSGIKSMPIYEDHDEARGYRRILEQSLRPYSKSKRLPEGGLAVVYDKNPMEAGGYAAAMADLFGESVHMVEWKDGDEHARVRIVDGVLQVFDDSGEWRSIRCAFRYVTQRPWNRIPVYTKTLILNPVAVCLAGGRNKAVAAKAYDLYNAELQGSGLSIVTPETYWDVAYEEVPMWVERLGGQAVVKVPYANAGQGVFTITNPKELQEFLDAPRRYDRFIVQALIGNVGWSSTGRDGRLYHVGTVPNRRFQSFVADLRMMVHSGPEGFRTAAIYARRARAPLADDLSAYPSWDMLGTNLSIRNDDGSWSSDSKRLLLMDRKDFNTLGIGVDDLIAGYVQTVLSTVAIENMAARILSKKRQLKTRFFRSLNNDPSLLSEIIE